jgi:hypothetical protein
MLILDLIAAAVDKGVEPSSILLNGGFMLADKIA